MKNRRREKKINCFNLCCNKEGVGVFRRVEVLS